MVSEILWLPDDRIIVFLQLDQLKMNPECWHQLSMGSMTFELGNHDKTIL
jgi:hypothetical protein